MISPDGTPMCRCSSKKAEWYVNQGLASVLSTDPLEIKLIFVPNGLGKSHDDFYLRPRINQCVVCGTSEKLTRHHCVPYCFRRYFGLEHKSSSSHDVQLLCTSCHDAYEVIASTKKLKLIKDHPMRLRFLQQNRLHTAAKAVLDHLDTMRSESLKAYDVALTEYFARPYDERDLEALLAEPKLSMNMVWQAIVDEFNDPEGMSREWRQHFVDVMNPQYLPEGWSVHRHGNFCPPEDEVL